MCSGAQSIILCEFCDDTKPVRWTCVTCNEDLCDSCKRSHERLKATRHHEIATKSGIVEKRVESRCTFHQNICTFYCPKCNDLLCTKCVTDKHLGHELQEIEQIHKERKRVISDTICKIEDLRISNIADKHSTLQRLRKETQSDRQALMHDIETQKQKLKKEINSAADRLLDKIDQFYDLEEMRQSQVCTEVNKMIDDLQQHSDTAETLLCSNDTHRFIGGEIVDVQKCLEKISEYQLPKEVKRASFVAKRTEPILFDNLLGTVQFPSFVIPDKGTKTLTLQYISKFDNLDSLEILWPIDPHNVWVRDKVSGTVRKWKRTNQTPMAADSETPDEFIAINFDNNAVEAISENGNIREIQRYKMWRPKCVDSENDVITLGLVNDRNDFEAGIERFGQIIKSPRRIIGFMQNYVPGLPEYNDQRAMVVQMTPSGETLLTFYYDNHNGIYGKIIDLIFCASNNMRILTLEKRKIYTICENFCLFKRNSIGEIIGYCNLPVSNPKEGGIVCTSSGLVLVLDFNNIVHFINNELQVVSKLCLHDVTICSAERLFLDKYDRVWVKGQLENEGNETIFITSISPGRAGTNTCVIS